MINFNGSYGVRRGLKGTLMSLAFLFLAVLIVKGLIILIPAAILVYAGYKGIKFIKSKVKSLGKKSDTRVEEFKLYNEKNEYVYNSEVIDVEYEEINR